MKSMNLNQGIFELYSVLLGLNEKKKRIQQIKLSLKFKSSFCPSDQNNQHVFFS